MAGVIPADELDDVVDATSELVGRLAFAFVAPLGTDNHDCGHEPHSRPQLETRWHNPPGPDVKSLSLTGAALFGRSDRVNRGGSMLVTCAAPRSYPFRRVSRCGGCSRTGFCIGYRTPAWNTNVASSFLRSRNTP